MPAEGPSTQDYMIRGVNLRFDFPGGNPKPEITPVEPLDTVVSYFIGGDPNKWHTNVPVWGGVVYHGVYPGVDLRISGESSGWDWDLNVSDASLFQAERNRSDDPGIRLRLEGQNAIRLENVALVISSEVGDLVLPTLKIGTDDPEGLPITFPEPFIQGNELVLLPPAELSTPSPTPSLAGTGTLAATDTVTPAIQSIPTQTPSPTSETNGSPTPGSHPSPSQTPSPTYMLDETETASPTNNLPSDPTPPGNHVLGAALYRSAHLGRIQPLPNQDSTSLGAPMPVAMPEGANPSAAHRSPAAQQESALLFSTYLGGSSSDFARAVSVDISGFVHVTGQTWSSDFPTTPGAFDESYYYYFDVFVADMSSDGSSLLYATYLGGSSHDSGRAIAVDSSGAAYVTGQASANFPITQGAYDATYGGSNDGYVAKLSPDGSDLIFSTYLGDTGSDQGGGIALGQGNEAIVTGDTSSSSFPTTEGAFDTSLNGSFDAFILRLESDGSALVYSTFLGGSSSDSPFNYSYGLALTISDDVFVSGTTYSSDFPTTEQAFDTTFNGGTSDAFVAAISANGSELMMATYIGGNSYDVGEDLVLDAFGNLLFVGWTMSEDFPVTSGSFDGTLNGGSDAFLLRLNAQGSSLLLSTFLGGSSTDHAVGLALRDDNTITLTGRTNSTNYPLTGNALDVSIGDYDAFVTAFNSTGSSVYYSSFLGGENLETGYDILPVDSDAFLLVGETKSSDFPTTQGAYDTSANGGSDAFVTEMLIPQVASVPLSSVLSGGMVLWGLADPRAYDLSAYGCAQGGCGDPINTETGGFDYAVSDLSVPTSAGPLVFQRSYSSLGTSVYTAPLGFGWAHNHDTRLIFPGDPGGQPGKVLFKAHSANQYEFLDNGDGTYSPIPGLLVSLTRDPGPPVTYVVVDPGQAAYAFDEYGKLASWADALGHAWSYTYDGNNRLDRVTDDTGLRYLDFDYDPQGRIERVADPTDRDVTFGYDGPGDLTSVTDVTDEVWTYVYDAQHRLRIAQDPDSNQIVRTEYDGEGRAYQQFDGADTLVLQVTYNPDGTATFTDALGNQTTHTFDERNTLTGTTNDAGDSASRSYDPNFRPESIADENQNTTQLTWSENGANLTQLIDAEDNQIDLSYNSLNSLTEIIDGRRNTTTYTYNETDPDPSRRTLLLDVDGPVPGTDDTTSYTYTTAADAPQPPGLLKTITVPSGNVTHFVYDQFGQRIEAIDPLTNPTHYSYDSLGRLETVEDPLGHVSWTCYDAAGRVVRNVGNAAGDGGTPQTDPCDSANYQPSSDPDIDRITTFVYDARGNLIATVDPGGVITRTYYDANGQPQYVVQNLSGQGIEVETPPTYNPDYPDRNARTETVYDTQGNAIAAIDNAGFITRTYFDSLNRAQYVVVNLVGQDISVGTPPAYNPSYPDQNVRTETVYDEVGNPIATVDTLGMITRTYYDGNNRAVTVVQNLVGQGISTSTPPNRGTVPDQNLRTDTVFDENGNAIATIDPLGIITRTYYDEANRPEFVVQNLSGQGIEVETPPSYNPSDPDQNVRTQNVYDDASNQIASIGTNGAITRTYYDDANRPTYVVRNLTGQGIGVETPPSYNPAFPDENVRTQRVYDEGGLAIATIDNAGVITRTYYDGLGRVRYVVRNLTGQAIDVGTPPAYNPTNPDQNVRTETIHDADGDSIGTVDPNGVITRTYYDGLHRAVTVVNNLVGQTILNPTPPSFSPSTPDQNVRTDTIYGGGGQVARTIDTLGHSTVSCYDGQYWVIKSVQNPSIGDPCGSYTPSSQPDEDLITLTNHDGIGNQLAVTDPNQKQTTYAYDEVYRLEGQTDPLLHATTYAYDLDGNRVGMTDAELIETKYEYDDLARLTAVVENYRQGINPDFETNVRTEYSYDGLGSRLSILDGNGHPTNFTYDDLGRLITESDALSHTTTYAYDAAGNRASIVDANGFTTAFGYDDLNRLTFIDSPDPDADVTHVYDAAGNRIDMSDGVGATHWTYDDLNRSTSVSDPYGSTVGYGYDGLGNRTSLTYPGAIGTVDYEYDDASRLQAVTDWDSLVTSYVFDKGGRLGYVTLPNGIVSTSIYDDAGRLSSLTHVKDSTTLASYEYTYDDVGNRLTASETVLQPGGATGAPDAIFGDGFESGTLGAWSSSSTGSGTLTVTTASALAGTYGMQALINSTSARYVQDTIPYTEPRYRARFYFDPNSSTMGNNNAYYLFYGYAGSSTVVLRVEFGYTTSNGYRLRVSAIDNGTTWTNSGWVNVTDGPHYVELDWQTATSGRVDWWIDGASQGAVTGFDNSARRIDQVRLGTVAGLDSGTTGTVYFDAFESRRQTYIGSGTALPDPIFADDFESGGFGYWSANTGVSVTTAASLAPAGTRGMSVPLTSATTAKYVTDNVPGVEPRYRARFYFDPNSTTMANSADHVLLYGDSGTTPALQLDLGYTTAGGYRMRTRIRDNASAWNNSTWVNITDSPHIIELDWQSGTSGSLAWWIDEAAQPAPSPINNSTRKIDRVRLGAVANVDATTNGTLYFDAFESRRQAYIGPMSGGVVTTGIVYDYDPLYRLTSADYNGGTTYFHYTYDAVGNRLTQVTELGSTSYGYDIANRLTSVGGVTYAWDNNGNLVNDGASTYTYNHANRLASVVQGVTTYGFTYNGLGDRVRQTINGWPTTYALDLEGGLTQVLTDGSSFYLYGVGRIGEMQTGGWRYHVADALGSVRELVDSSDAVALARGYAPFGSTLYTDGTGATAYGFTGEQRDATGLMYVRARYYSPAILQWTQTDPLLPSPWIASEWNRFTYVGNNPITLTDPSGLSPNAIPSGNLVARFVTDRMRADAASQAIAEIYQLNNTHYVADACTLYSEMSWWEKLIVGPGFLEEAARADLAARALASARFGCLVAPANLRPTCGQWDYKEEIGRTWGYFQTVDFSAIGFNDEVTFYYDIWANFHFGFVGTAGGFSQDELLTGAAIVHYATNRTLQNDPSDILANIIGIYIYSYGNPNETTLLSWIYIERSNLNKARVDKFGNVEVYR